MTFLAPRHDFSDASWRIKKTRPRGRRGTALITMKHFKKLLKLDVGQQQHSEQGEFVHCSHNPSSDSSATLMEIDEPYGAVPAYYTASITTNFNSIPREVICFIFSFLSRQEWSSVLVTCRLWSQVGAIVFCPSVEDLLWACDYGKEHCVRRILRDERLDFPGSVDVPMLLKDIIQNNATSVMCELLRDGRIDPSGRDNAAIGDACAMGHLEMVELLLKHPKVNPSTQDNWAIRCALDYGHLEIVKALLRDGRLDWIHGKESSLADDQKKRLQELKAHL